MHVDLCRLTFRGSLLLPRLCQSEQSAWVKLRMFLTPSNRCGLLDALNSDLPG